MRKSTAWTCKKCKIPSYELVNFPQLIFRSSKFLVWKVNRNFPLQVGHNEYNFYSITQNMKKKLVKISDARWTKIKNGEICSSSVRNAKKIYFSSLFTIFHTSLNIPDAWTEQTSQRSEQNRHLRSSNCFYVKRKPQKYDSSVSLKRSTT